MGTIRIVEFMGLPGCGKTTICRAIKEYVKDRQFLLINDYQLPKGIIKKVILFFQSHSFSFLFVLLYYLYANNISRKKGMLVYEFNMYMKYASFMKEHKNDNSILLVDQGIVQGIGSMSLDKGDVQLKGLNGLLYFWGKFKRSILLVECALPIVESAKRLTNRNTLGGKFDSMRGDALKDAMKAHSLLLENVNYVLEQKKFDMNRVHVSTLNSVKSVISQIINNI